jgi:hypothetical protein
VINLSSKYGDSEKIPSKSGYAGTFFAQESFELVALDFFWVPKCRKFTQKNEDGDKVSLKVEVCFSHPAD